MTNKGRQLAKFKKKPRRSKPANPTAASASVPFQKELHPQESNFMKTVARHGLAKVSQQNRPKENPEYGVRQVRALKPRKCQQICFLQNRNRPLCYTPSASYPISFSINIKHSPTTLPYSTAQVPGKNAYRPFHFVSAKAGAKK